ncbi:hypothetical protein F4778DRAFT_405785 [Xylariomycetidae sp. FL2044]|nr:hypothetical protein F4778DRAFT_405785 [Xylariomycetidae sp. FL2044]
MITKSPSQVLRTISTLATLFVAVGVHLPPIAPIPIPSAIPPPPNTPPLPSYGLPQPSTFLATPPQTPKGTPFQTRPSSAPPQPGFCGKNSSLLQPRN